MMAEEESKRHFFCRLTAYTHVAGECLPQLDLLWSFEI